MKNFTYDDELYHYGVKGMKWHKRKAGLKPIGKNWDSSGPRGGKNSSGSDRLDEGHTYIDTSNGGIPHRVMARRSGDRKNSRTSDKNRGHSLEITKYYQDKYGYGGGTRPKSSAQKGYVRNTPGPTPKTPKYNPTNHADTTKYKQLKNEPVSTPSDERKKKRVKTLRSK